MNVIDYNPWGGEYPWPSSTHFSDTTNPTVTASTIEWWHKPEGRGRHFRRKARGLSRRLRLWFVKQTRWEQAHAGVPGVTSAQSYGPPWTSDNALADYSFACTCHKRERYDRRKGR